MPCGCKSNKFKSRNVYSPRSSGIIRPVQRTVQNTATPIQAQNINQTTSQTPTQARSPSGINQENKRVQQLRREAIRKAFNK